MAKWTLPEGKLYSQADLDATVIPKQGVPDDDRQVLVAWRYSGGMSFSVGRYWWTEDSDTKVWVADDGEVMCFDDEVLGWWELAPFLKQVMAKARAQKENPDG